MDIKNKDELLTNSSFASPVIPNPAITAIPSKKKTISKIAIILFFVLLLLVGLCVSYYIFNTFKKKSSPSVNRISDAIPKPSITPPVVMVNEEIFKERNPSLNSTIPITGTIKKGEKIDLKIDVDEESETIFYITAGSSKINFSLVSPSGKVINENYASNNPKEVTYEKNGGVTEILTYQTYTIKLPEKGVWIVKLVSEDITDYKVMALRQKGMSLQAAFDKTIYKVGEKAIIAARFSDTSALTDLQVFANIQLPNGVVNKINLTRNNNNIFVGMYVIPEVSGYISVDVNAQGLHEGYPFTRNGVLLASVNAEGVKLTGVYREEAVDNNNDGLFDELNLILEVETDASVEAAISAELYFGSEIITQRGDFFKLVKGKQNITLSFNGESIYEQKTDGPYSIKRIFITPIETGIVSDSKEETVLNTKAYKYTQFEVPKQ